jgi:hypothetical protein
VINGTTLLVAFILLVTNYSKIRNVEPYKLVLLTLLFSLATGVHGLSHMGLEHIYHYNPIQQLKQLF